MECQYCGLLSGHKLGCPKLQYRDAAYDEWRRRYADAVAGKMQRSENPSYLVGYEKADSETDELEPEDD